MVRALISERRWQRGKTGPSHEYTIGGWVRGLRDHHRLIEVASPFCLTGNVREPRRWRVPRPNSNGSFTCGTESNCLHRKSLGTAFGTVRLPVGVRSRVELFRDSWTQNRPRDYLLVPSRRSNPSPSGPRN